MTTAAGERAAGAGGSLEPGPGPEPEVKEVKRKRGLRTSVLELLYKLRTEGDSPGRQAAAVGVGVFIGCSPFYGLHLALCILFARIFRLNQFLTYLAAHVSVPGLWPLLVLAELQLGRWLRGERLLPLTFAGVRHLDPWRFAGDLLLGSAVVGGVLAVVLSWVMYQVARRSRRSSETARLIEETSRCYIEAGIFAWEFARGKLRHDPVYFSLLREGRLPREGLLLDLGCGRGLLFSLILAAREQVARGQYVPGWELPPEGRMEGVEGNPRRAKEARLALGEGAEIRTADLREAELGVRRARAVLLLDVLHYLGAEEQERLLDRAVAALEPGGSVLVREADAAAGGAFRKTRAAERLCAVGRGHWRQKFFFRSTAEWEAMLRARGLRVRTVPMAEGTPYANVLIEGEREPYSPAPPDSPPGGG